MTSTVKSLHQKGLISPPKFLLTNTQYETIMGSIAYGVSGDSSDYDVYGFAIPHKDVVFPHLAGEILGFGRQKKRFEQYQEHHIFSPTELGGRGRNYDITIYNIVKYFQLCMDNNPNMIDSLFTPQNCVLHITKIGAMVRDNRHIFLHKGSWHKFKGYSYSQLHKMKNKKPQGKRKEMVDKHGFDLKYAYNLVRLLLEVEQILEHGDLDLQRDREHLKAIRRGDISENDIIQWASEKEKSLEKLYNESKIPYGPDEDKIKNLLFNCLEEQYGNLDKCVVREDKIINALREIQEICEANL